MYLLSQKQEAETEGCKSVEEATVDRLVPITA